MWRMQHQYLYHIPRCKTATLQLAKPLAVPYADAARVEIHIELASDEADLSSADTAVAITGAEGPPAVLKIIKPYV